MATWEMKILFVQRTQENRYGQGFIFVEISISMALFLFISRVNKQLMFRYR